MDKCSLIESEIYLQPDSIGLGYHSLDRGIDDLSLVHVDEAQVYQTWCLCDQEQFGSLGGASGV